MGVCKKWRELSNVTHTRTHTRSYTTGGKEHLELTVKALLNKHTLEISFSFFLLHSCDCFIKVARE